MKDNEFGEIFIKDEVDIDFAKRLVEESCDAIILSKSIVDDNIKDILSKNDKIVLYEGLTDELVKEVLAKIKNNSFTHLIPEDKIVMMFVDDSNRDKDSENFTDNYKGQYVKYYRQFETYDSFIEEWKRISERPIGMWYWVITEGKCICSGACDPDDIEIFEDYFKGGKE